MHLLFLIGIDAGAVRLDYFIVVFKVKVLHLWWPARVCFGPCRLRSREDLSAVGELEL